MKVAVSAIFWAYDTTGQVYLEDLNMLAMEMTYVLARPGHAPDTDTCWSVPGGTLVRASFTDRERALPDTVVKDGEWMRAEFVMRGPPGPAPLPVVDDFETWQDPHYAKFHVTRDAESLSGLFELPQGPEYRLIYGRETIETVWRWEDRSIWPLFDFDAGTWLKSLDPGGPWTFRTDLKGAPYVVFSPTENASTWADLNVRFPGSFRSDTLRIR